MIVLDTSILIEHMRQRGKGKKSLFDRISSVEGNYNLGISVVTVQELYQGKSTREKEKEEEMLDLLSYLKIYTYDEDLSATAGKIARDWKPEMEFADAAIAATAINEGCHLFTLNTRDFQNIPSLTLYYLPLWR